MCRVNLRTCSTGWWKNIRMPNPPNLDSICLKVEQFLLFHFWVFCHVLCFFLSVIITRPNFLSFLGPFHLSCQEFPILMHRQTALENGPSFWRWAVDYFSSCSSQKLSPENKIRNCTKSALFLFFKKSVKSVWERSLHGLVKMYKKRSWKNWKMEENCCTVIMKKPKKEC